MKTKFRIFSALFLTTLFFNDVNGQTTQIDKDIASVDGIITALYASISGEKGEARNWEQFKKLFVADAKLIPTRKGQDGKVGLRPMTPQQYIDNANDWLINNGFHEEEIFRVTDTFGNIIHVFSTYDSRHGVNDEKPYSRGINSIQLLNDGERYWVVNIYWMSEDDNNPIPAKYLPE